MQRRKKQTAVGNIDFSNPKEKWVKTKYLVNGKLTETVSLSGGVTPPTPPDPTPTPDPDAPTSGYYNNAVQDYDGNYYDAVIIGQQV